MPGELSIMDNPFIQTDTVSGNYVYWFIKKTNSGTLNIESWYFDHDFNYIRNDKENIPLELVRNKLPWWDFREEAYRSNTIIAEDNDYLLLKKKKCYYTYDWKYHFYDKMSKNSEKVQLRENNIERFFHFRNWSKGETDEYLYVLYGIKSASDKFNYCKEFQLLKINRDLTIVKNLTIRFDYPQDIVYPGFIDRRAETKKNTFDKDIIIFFAPRDVGREASDPVNTNYTYLRINEDLDIVDRLSFNSLAPCCAD